VDSGRLIISAIQPPEVYVQAAQDDAELLVEAVADRYLPPGSRIGAAGDERMRGLGWKPEGDFENWAHTLTWPAATGEYKRAADMMVGALRDVYGVPDPSALTYKAWNDLDTPPEQEWSQLGIAHRPD
jgi:hypothetical protein